MKNILTPFFALMLLVLAGCGESETRPPSNLDAGHDAGPTVTDAGPDASPDTGVDAGNPCFGTSGCFTDACSAAQASPTAPDLWFLNHCTSAYCAPFDNAARIPGYSGPP